MNSPFDDSLPVGWAVAPASDVCEKIQDGTHFSPKVQLQEGRYRYVTAKNVRPGGLDLADITFLREEDHRAIYTRCDAQKDDVLLVKDGVNAGDAAINTADDEISLLSSVCFLRPVAKLLAPTFLRYYLQSPRAFRVLTGNLTGTAIRRIVLRRVKQLPIVVAPVPEQHRIVSAIEGHFSRLDEAVALLERVQRNLKRYRASVLKAAVEGRLVPTDAALARAEGRTYEPASVLLERISEERRRRWEANGGRGNCKEPAAPEATDLPELPEGWCWTTVESLYWDAGYGTSQKCAYDADGPAVLRIPNVQSQSLNLDDIKYAMSANGLPSDGAVKPGDFLFIRTNGSRALIGRGAVVTEPLPREHYFASYLIRLRLVDLGVLPRWVGRLWHTTILRDQILRDAASSAGQYNVSLGAARTYAIPLPPMAEQGRILAEVEMRWSVADAVETTLVSNVARCARLRQSILKWAFDGRLAAQDPADEPAHVLLERIRAERAAAPKAARRGRPHRQGGAT